MPDSRPPCNNLAGLKAWAETFMVKEKQKCQLREQCAAKLFLRCKGQRSSQSKELYRTLSRIDQMVGQQRNINNFEE